MIEIYCKNTGSRKKFPEGISLLKMLDDFKFKRPFRIVSAKVNNVSKSLNFRAYNNLTVEFLDLRDPAAMRVYRRSLSFLLCKAAQDVFPKCHVYMEHPISNGYFCNVRKADRKKLSLGDVGAIRARMHEIVAEKMPFHREDVPVDEAIKTFRKRGQLDKVKLLETSGTVYADYYTLGDTPDFYYGRLVPDAGYLDLWSLESFHDGLLLRVPDRHNPKELAPFIDMPKTFSMFSENKKWNSIMHLNTVGDVNKACQMGRASELIQVAEALQEKKIVQIAEEIEKRYRGKQKVRLVLITGPSSSGKSTVCKRLCVQLKACGLKPVSFSTDDYFVNRVDSPKFPDGSYDFDNFETIDHDALQRDIELLLAGKEVEIPHYNFVTGLREYNGRKVSLGPGNILLVEGIHALNPRLSDKIPDFRKYRIFISTMTGISLDNHNVIPTSDNRLLRRIIRDYNCGAFTAEQTINQWPKVRASEEVWINPYQENADVMFNSAYLVEFAVLRNHAEPILQSVPKNRPAYSEAHRLLKFIHYFTPVPDKEIPPTSLLRAFIGGGI